MLFAIIFLISFVFIGIFAWWLSKNIDHGEARFGADGKVIGNHPSQADGSATPARRIEADEETNKTKASDDE